MSALCQCHHLPVGECPVVIANHGSRERELLERVRKECLIAEHLFHPDHRTGIRQAIAEIDALLATPAPPGADWALRAANRIADEHKGAWAGVMLQVHWMADVIRECAAKDTPAPVTPETPRGRPTCKEVKRVHALTCAVPLAYFADDSSCTCGLREQIDALSERAALPKEEK